MNRLDTRGFTFPELLVAIAIMFVMAVAAAVILHSTNYAAQENQAHRRLALAGLGQVLNKYKAENGHWPAGIPAKQTLIGSLATEYNLCAELVPAYIPDIPVDPSSGYKLQGANKTSTTQACDQKDVMYFSGYAIALQQNGGLVLTADGDKAHVVTLTLP